MDAIKKKKIWKVIGCHFGFTVLFILISLSLPARMIPNYSNPSELIRFVCVQIIYLLQPIVFQFVHSPTLATIIMPIWSIFFGWLFSMFVIWLNHFPVLGRKVF
jgi:hypothetical protein